MKIVFIGDSITDANHNYSEDILGEGYVKIIADILRKSHLDIEIFNKGHDGFTVSGLWRMLDYDCISKAPDIVSILIGCNDISVEKSTGKTLEEQGFQELYERILKRIRQETNAKIICMGPFVFPHPQEFANWIPQIKKAEDIARAAAEKYGAVFVPLHEELNDAVKFAGYAYEKITVDGIHLTEEGAGIVAEKWLEAVVGNRWL